MFTYRFTFIPEGGAPINASVICALSELDEKIYKDILIDSHMRGGTEVVVQFTVDMDHIATKNDLALFKGIIMPGYKNVQVTAKYIGPSLNLSDSF